MERHDYTYIYQRTSCRWTMAFCKLCFWTRNEMMGNFTSFPISFCFKAMWPTIVGLMSRAVHQYKLLTLDFACNHRSFEKSSKRPLPQRALILSNTDGGRVLDWNERNTNPACDTVRYCHYRERMSCHGSLLSNRRCMKGNAVEDFCYQCKNWYS